MTLDASKELAMILPLPVKTPAAENDVEFIDLQRYPNFFTIWNRVFQAGDTARLWGKALYPPLTRR